MESFKKILMDEYKEIQHLLDKKYDRQLVAEGAHIGMFLIASKYMGDDVRDIKHDESEICPFELFEDEIKDTAKYFGYYSMTKDEKYLKLASEELAHAKIFIDDSEKIARTQEEKNKLMDYKRRYDILSKNIRTRNPAY